MPRHLVFSLLMLLLPFWLGAQAPQDDYLEEPREVHQFDQKKWQDLKKGLDYTVEEKPEEEETPPAMTDSPAPSSGPQFAGLGTFLQYFLIVAGIVLVFFLLVKLLGGGFGPRNKKLEAVSAIELAEIEENLEEAELVDPLRRAVAAGDYTLAVRLYYLSILRTLTLQEHIRWKRDKTNGEYLRELAGSSFAPTFREITLIFERIWYGTVTVGQGDFAALEHQFKKALAAAEQLPKP